MIVFLAPRLDHARSALFHDYEVVSMQGPDRGEYRDKEGANVPFRIVTREEQLRGLQISDFAILHPVPDSLVRLARSRLRR